MLQALDFAIILFQVKCVALVRVKTFFGHLLALQVPPALILPFVLIDFHFVIRASASFLQVRAQLIPNQFRLLAARLCALELFGGGVCLFEILVLCFAIALPLNFLDFLFHQFDVIFFGEQSVLNL